MQPTSAPLCRHWRTPPAQPTPGRRRIRPATCCGVGPLAMTSTSRALHQQRDAPLRFSKHFAREATTRRAPKDRRRTLPRPTWQPQLPPLNSDNTFFDDYKSYGNQHPAHRVHQPRTRRIVSQDCLCPNSAFRRGPPPSAFHITAPGYDCRYQVLAVTATPVDRPPSPDYPWAPTETRQSFVSDSKCARWILNNL